MSDIFISYSRNDEDFGRRLHARLTRMKRDVWMDWEDIPFNSDWWEEIKRGIETSDNFLIILTNNFVRSPVCMLEVDYARQNNKRILVLAHNFEESHDTYAELKKRTSESETVQQLLGDRNIVNISRDNWTSIGHVNWQFFNDDTTFEMDFHHLIETLDTDLNHVRSHTNLQVRALEWYTNEKDWSFLLTGVQIDQAEKWLYQADVENKVPPPTFVQREFIKMSREQHDEQEKSIQEMEGRAKRFRQASIVAGAIAAVMVVIGIGLTIWTGMQAVDAQNQLATADNQVAEAQNQQSTANAQAINAGETLTAIPPTFEAIQLQVDENNTQVAAVGETLTPIGATLEFAENERNQAQILADNAQTQVAQADTALENANASLTPVAVTLTRSADEQATASYLVDEANSNLSTASVDSITAEALVFSAETQVADAEFQIANANDALNQAVATLSPIAPTLTQASNQIASANDASTESAAQLATATVQIANVSTEVANGNIRIENANAVLTQIVPTLTQAGDLVMEAEIQVANASTQVADVDNQIATADTQNQILASTAEAIREEAERSQQQAQSQSLVVNADQVAVNGDIDLALALLVESYSIDPNLPQTRRLLNDIAYTSARFILEDATFVTFSSDSSLVVYGVGNEVVVLDIETRSEVIRLKEHSDTVVAGEFNFAGDLFITGSTDASVLIWDTQTWEVLRVFDDLPAPVTDVVFDTPGEKIGFVLDADRAYVVDIDDDFEVIEFDFDDPDTHLTKIEFYGDGTRFMAWGVVETRDVIYRANIAEQSYFRLFEPIYTTLNPAYDVNAGHVVRWGMVETEIDLTIYDIIALDTTYNFDTGFNWVRGEDRIGERAFNSSGSYVVVSLANEREETNDIILFNVGERERSSGLEFRGDGTERVTALAFSPDGRTVLSGYGRYLILWDTETGRELRRFGTHLDDIVDIQYSLDSNHAITLSRDGNYRVWDVSYSDPAVIREIFVPNRSGVSISNPGLSPDNSQITFSIASDIYGFDTNTGQQITATFSYFGLQDIFYSRTDPYIVTTTADTPNNISTAMMWDVSSDDPRLWVTAPGDSNNVIDPAGSFSLDGRQIAISSSASIQIYDVTEPYNPVLTNELDRNGMHVGATVFSPDGSILYAAVNRLEDEVAFAIVSWNLNTDERNIVPIPHIYQINSMDISADGTQILTASNDGTVVLFDIENGVLLRRMVGHRGAVNEVYFGLDDLVALSASDDGSMILWDLRTGQSIRRYVTGNPITGLYLSNDDTIAVSTDGRDFVTIWRIETLDDVITWLEANREIPALSAEQCLQYNIDCDDD